MREDWYERYVERLKIKIVIGIIVIFFVSLAMSYQEIHYMLSGKTADGTVTTQVQQIRQNGALYEKSTLHYTWKDGDEDRDEYLDVPSDWSHPDGAIKIDYIPGSKTQSRFSGTHRYGWVGIFITSVVLGIGGFIWLSRGGK